MKKYEKLKRIGSKKVGMGDRGMIIPEGWKKKRFLDFVELHRGYDLPIQDRQKGEIPVIGSNVIVGYHSEAKLVGPGVITGRSGSIGLAYYIEHDYWPLNTALYVSKFKNNFPGFVYFFFKHFDFKSCSTGASVPTLNRNTVHECFIAVPPLPEQKKIAAVLFVIQKAIEIQEKIIETTIELKKSTMQHVFTYGLRGEKTKETEIGRIPESWEEKALEKVADISYGAQAAVANAKDPSIGTPIFTNINITKEGKIDLSILRYYAVQNDKRNRLILRKGDVLFNWRSGSKSHVGKTAYFDLKGEYTYSSFILRFRVFEAVLDKFLYYYFNYLKKCDFFSNRRNVSSINSVYNASLAATIPVYYPPEKEDQREIIDIINVIDSKIDLHTEKKSALQYLFKAMLNKLMTGKIRVKNLDIDMT